ncbi:WD40-repeat-containing domain protein [Boeremia exigua]|uniref:WD40-repeat-containing domain protein n=1 Tax=Boeremia exigua TaxID=749465 RepID=UPI001E8E8746|nr:WD40-repeat-containing domain protein [Boeremia exigua]KAH6620470.1 WD40-repeat-containing domain protein [Boeremia exigua]
MPFHHSNQQQQQFTLAAGLGQAAQLGSIGSPHGNLRVATAGTTSAGTDAFAAPGSAAPDEQHAAPPAAQQQQQQQQPPPSQSQSQSQMYGGPAPNVGLQQATPQGAHYSTPASLPSLPGSLQPAQRPGPASANTAPSVPTQNIASNANSYTLPTRSNTIQSQPASAHTYSRSSPAGMGPDQKYIPFSNTPEQSKYAATTPSQKYYPATPAAGAAQAPLGLADIRPRANSSMDPEGGLGASNAFVAEQNKTATNSSYLAPWSIYAYDWCKWNVPGGNSAGKMAVGSYIEDNHNFIRILDTHITPQHDAAPGAAPFGLEYSAIAEATCSFPVTRILWEPPSSQKQSTDLLATSGDHLRLWSLPQPSGNNLSNTISRTSSVNTREPQLPKLTPLALLSNSKTPEHTAPLTSLDWNTMSPKLIITSSIDTTCTIWDIPTLTAKTQLIAHDKEVFDVRFCAGSVDVFVSCGADGSVRMFDLRSLEHSTIIYEPSDKNNDKDKGSPTGRMSPTKAQQTMSYAPPLLRLAASPHDSHLLATFAQDSNVVRILDVRQPGQALLELRGHSAALNSIEWNPSRRGMLASGGDDSLVLVWDLLHANTGAAISSEHAAPPQPVVAPQPANGTGAQNVPVGQKGPYASWRCDYEVGNISWAPQSALTGQGGDWVGVAGGRGVWGVKL